MNTNKSLTRKEEITKEVYVRVLDELLKEKEFSEIKVSEIIELSGLSRATFYKYFHDKYELAVWRYANFLEDLGSIDFSSQEEVDKIMAAIIQFINSNKASFKKIIQYMGQNSFIEYYVKYSINVAKEKSSKYGYKLSSKDEYTIRYHAIGTIEVLREWIETKNDLTVEDIIDVIVNNHRNSGVRPYYLPR